MIIDFNLLDFFCWLGILVVLKMVLPKQYTEELGYLIYLFICAVITIVWVILFVFIDYDVIDIFHWFKFDFSKHIKFSW